METESVDNEPKAAGTAEGPQWHDVPTCAGWWMEFGMDNDDSVAEFYEVKNATVIAFRPIAGVIWLGPLPEPPQ